MSDENTTFQTFFYLGNTANAVLYGVELVFFVATVTLVERNKDERNQRSFRIFFYFSMGVFAMITIYVTVQATFGLEMWIENADYPGGSGAYFADHAAVWYQTLGTTASVVLNIMSDGFLLYRCYIAWSDWRVMLLPSFLYISSVCIGIGTSVITGLPNANFFSGLSKYTALTYSCSVIALNVTVSALICLRLLLHARSIRGALGSRVASKYTGTVALLVESALPYTLFGVAFVVTLGMEHPSSILFLSIYVMFTCISPQMIVLRVVMGRSFSEFEEAATPDAWPNVNITILPDDGARDIEIGLPATRDSQKDPFRQSTSSGSSPSTARQPWDFQ
ncbi:hypothetical protein GSI_03331 [Ganoderma sinense ZZ0214-1]|uniref:Uncharacterized protein n=1 Tax=Ganoderma sinense ZZ0214-1 TaxID=1077348 RepID=A0A2G8SLD6_9APHY|nr:hypothetical protein GSI_03331 [Ganoderma sinense ZZ0214-1]